MNGGMPPQSLIAERLAPSILAASPDCIKVLSAEGIVEFMNDTGVELNQLSGASDVLGKEFASMWPEEEREKIRSAVASAAAGQPSRVEGFCPTAKGEPRWWEASFSALNVGDETKVVGISRDITKRVKAEHAQAVAAERLEELNRTLEERVAQRTAELEKTQSSLRQSQKMEAVGQLTGGLAHDFNNLLTGISGNIELMQLRASQGKAARDLQQYMDSAQGAAKRAAALTHRLLAFSRRQTLAPKVADINHLVGDLNDLVRRTIGPSIELEVIGASGLWPAYVDANQLENALLNLCINSRDAMPEGGRVTIETANKWLDERAAAERDLPQGQYISICVTDSGSGMSADVAERAFEPFFTTKPIGAGTGLGLSMVYGFARQSGGQVRIYSELGKGTTVCVYLPRFVGEAQRQDPMEDFTRTESSSNSETVLIIDDEPTIRALVLEVLADYGYEGIEAADGAAGLRLLESNMRIDLLITDVGLPGGLNGRQVADAARRLRPHLKTLFITGFAENAAVGDGHLERGMEVLTKPFAIDELARRIYNLMNAVGVATR